MPFQGLISKNTKFLDLFEENKYFNDNTDLVIKILAGRQIKIIRRRTIVR